MQLANFPQSLQPRQQWNIALIKNDIESKAWECIILPACGLCDIGRAQWSQLRLTQRSTGAQLVPRPPTLFNRTHQQWHGPGQLWRIFFWDPIAVCTRKRATDASLQVILKVFQLGEVFQWSSLVCLGQRRLQRHAFLATLWEALSESDVFRRACF